VRPTDLCVSSTRRTRAKRRPKRRVYLTWLPRLAADPWESAAAANEAALKAMASRVLSGVLTPRALAEWAHSAFGHNTIQLAERLAELDDAYDVLEYYPDRTIEQLDAEVAAEARSIVRLAPRRPGYERLLQVYQTACLTVRHGNPATRTSTGSTAAQSMARTSPRFGTPGFRSTGICGMCGSVSAHHVMRPLPTAAGTPGSSAVADAHRP